MVADDEFKQIDLRLVFERMYERRWLVIGCTAVVGLVFAAAALLMTPIYRAEVLMVPAAQESGQGLLGGELGQLSGLASLAGINIGGGGVETEEALAVFKTREFGERFILEMDLIPKFFPKSPATEASRWAILARKRPTPAQAFRYLDRNVLNVSQDKKTGLVTLRVDWKDRLEAAEWANDFVRRLNTEMRERAIARTSANLEFLNKQLESVSTIETRQAISRLVESQIRQRMLANVSPEYAFRVIGRALPADADDPVWPRKLVLVAAGIILGFFTGGGIALIFPRKF